MNGQEYLQQLEQRLAHYYDKKPLPKAPAFVLAAELNAADEGYFIVPSLKTYSVQHNEYLYAAHFDKADCGHGCPLSAVHQGRYGSAQNHYRAHEQHLCPCAYLRARR